MANNFRGFQKNSSFKGHVKPLARKANTAIFFAFFLSRENLQVAIPGFHCLRTWRKASVKFHCFCGVIFVQNRNILGLVQTPNFS